jgi:hypothetical protein
LYFITTGGDFRRISSGFSAHWKGEDYRDRGDDCQIGRI